MTFRYIGSKARLADTIVQHLGDRPTGGRFVDAFCGTGAVAESAAQLGWPIWANDHLQSAVVVTEARLIADDQVSFGAHGGYAAAIQSLNSLAPIEGPIWREYSPASNNFTETQRRYFTEGNAGRIDAIRREIALWQTQRRITKIESTLLIADLLSAMNRVANIAGTYGCFLSRWQSTALKDISLTPRELKQARSNVITTSIDVASLAVESNDLVYLDPPYTKRQYASYYHIPETVAIGDEPEVIGVSGLRPWQSKASVFCYKVKALQALSDLIQNLDAQRILLSYSAEGHVPIDELHSNLEAMGDVTTHALRNVGRYRPNRTASSNSSQVREYLIVVEKERNQEMLAGNVA
ncbi:MAG: DNA adenine methylase [Pseudomonadota bacterium]